MAVCLLCTCAKESLPWPIKDRFVECGSPSVTVQPHVWYGTDTRLGFTPIILAWQSTRRPEQQREPGADTWSGGTCGLARHGICACTVLLNLGAVSISPHSWPKSIYEPLMCPVVVAGVTEVGTDPRYTWFNSSISCGESVQPLQRV